MSETTDSSTPEPTEATGNQSGDQGNPDELGEAGKRAIDRMKSERNAEKRRADQAEARLREIEDRDKSEAQKAADRIAQAEAEIAGLPAKVADALREHLMELHSFNAEDAELFLTASDPELLLKQAARLLARNEESQRPRTPRPDPNQGRQPTTPLDPKAADLAQIEADIAAARRR